MRLVRSCVGAASIQTHGGLLRSSFETNRAKIATITKQVSMLMVRAVVHYKFTVWGPGWPQMEPLSRPAFQAGPFVR